MATVITTPIEAFNCFVAKEIIGGYEMIRGNYFNSVFDENLEAVSLKSFPPNLQSKPITTDGFELFFNNHFETA